MTTEQILEKVKTLFNKMEIPDALEVYHKIGEQLHNRVEQAQTELAEKNSSLEEMKSKLPTSR